MSLPTITLARRSLLRRSYSTAAAQSNSKLPFILLGFGTLSAAGYLYLNSRTPPKPKQEKSPFDPQTFLDFKLKKVVPYNHNTSR